MTHGNSGAQGFGTLCSDAWYDEVFLKPLLSRSEFCLLRVRLGHEESQEKVRYRRSGVALVFSSTVEEGKRRGLRSNRHEGSKA